jgi:signal transduction histidine kinase
VVEDKGPGIPIGSGERGRSDRGSTGLGLDIARRCAEAAGGRLIIRTGSSTGGAVELWLAAP